MRLLTPQDIDPCVRIANDIPVQRGMFWGPRTLMDLELILVIEGRFAYEEAGGEPLSVVAGEVLCIPPEVAQTFRHLSARGRISCIHCDLLPTASWAAGDYRLDPAPQRVTPTGDDARLRELFPQCAALYEGYHPYRDAVLATMVREIWLRLAARWATPARAPGLSPRMAAMIDYLRVHLHAPLSRQALAEAFALTPQYVNALFRRELGISPTQFLHRERILRAWRYLQHDGLTLDDTAARVGFQDTHYFLRIFKKITGMRPSQMR